MCVCLAGAGTSFTESCISQLRRRLPWRRAVCDQQSASFVLCVSNITSRRRSALQSTSPRSCDHNTGTRHEATIERLKADDRGAAGGEHGWRTPREREETQVKILVLWQQKQEGQRWQEVGRVC